ncbi:MAG: MerR family transcriptional regulator, partial [Actinomycetota bacterium]|nr:MerR family transcriptional regulator [Actinomycetota bacterium]
AGAVSAPAAVRGLRIGELARLAETTPRTIRYYEEIGLLPGGGSRAAGQHRVYSEADVERLREIVRLRDLLGVTLDELKQLVEAEDARAALRAEWARGVDDPARRRAILDASLRYIDGQLELVRRRQRELDRLAGELSAKRRRVRGRRRQLEG